MHTRLFLLAVGWAMGLVAWETAADSPPYLAAAGIWAALEAVASISCIAAAAAPHRGLTALSGASVVCSALGRACGILVQIIRDPEVSSASLTGAVAWSLIAGLSFVVWKHYVAIWAAAKATYRRPAP